MISRGDCIFGIAPRIMLAFNRAVKLSEPEAI